MKRIALLGSLLLLIAACGDSGAETSTTTSSTTSSTTTLPQVPPLPTSTEVPLSATVEHLQWEGRVTLRTAIEEGMRAEGVLTVEGGFTAPDAHHIAGSRVSVVIDPASEMVEPFQQTWDATTIDGVVWISREDGPSVERTLANAPEEFELLSTAVGAIIPSDVLLADLMGRPWVTGSVLGRPVMEFTIDEAWMDLYGALFGAVLVDDPIPGSDPGTATLSLDPESGLVLKARLVLTGEEEGQPIDASFSFEVTAIDDDADRVVAPTG